MNNRDPNHDVIDNLFDEIRATRTALEEINQTLCEKKALLEVCIVKGIASGEITGKNDKERMASALEILPTMHEVVDKIQAEQIRAKMNYDLAILALDQFKLHLRYAEYVNKAAMISFSLTKTGGDESEVEI